MTEAQGAILIEQVSLLLAATHATHEVLQVISERLLIVVIVIVVMRIIKWRMVRYD